MPSETLRPFLTPQRVDNFPATHSSIKRRQRTTKFITIGLSLTGIALFAVILGITIWNTIRISKLESDVQHLDNVIESMKKRLGINYLEELNDFEKEYKNTLIDDPGSLDSNEDLTLHDELEDNDNLEEDIDDDEDEDADDDLTPEDEDEYDNLGSYDWIKKFRDYNESDEDDDVSDDNTEENISDEDNLYDDFEKFKDSKKKLQRSSRKARSIVDIPNDLQEDNATLSQINKENKTAETQVNATASRKHHHNNRAHKHLRNHKHHFISENIDDRRSHLRPRTHRRRKIPMIKSGESLISAKTTRYASEPTITPAAHFHLNRKVPDRYAAIKVDSYPGDLYIGHPSWTNEISSENYFTVENGVLSVHEPGLYYIYAQVCYNNTHDQNGFVIFHEHKPFLQCLNTVPTNMPHKIHTCHTSGLIYLKENETIHIRDFHSDRNVILKDTNNRSYFGLIKI